MSASIEGNLSISATFLQKNFFSAGHLQNDYEADGRILNVSFSAKRPDLPGEVLYTQQFLQERVYLRRHALTKLTTLQVSSQQLVDDPGYPLDGLISDYVNHRSCHSTIPCVLENLV